MKNNSEKMSPTKVVAVKTAYAALQILKEAGGYLSGKEVMNKIADRVSLSEWELERYDKTNYIRWESILHFYSINLIKAGFLRKQKGIWYITEEGEKALKLSPVELLEKANALYREWASANKKPPTDDIELEEPVAVQKVTLRSVGISGERRIKGFYCKEKSLRISGYGCRSSARDGILHSIYCTQRSRWRSGYCCIPRPAGN